MKRTTLLTAAIFFFSFYALLFTAFIVCSIAGVKIDGMAQGSAQIAASSAILATCLLSIYYLATELNAAKESK